MPASIVTSSARSRLVLGQQLPQALDEGAAHGGRNLAPLKECLGASAMAPSTSPAVPRQPEQFTARDGRLAAMCGAGSAAPPGARRRGAPGWRAPAAQVVGAEGPDCGHSATPGVWIGDGVEFECRADVRQGALRCASYRSNGSWIGRAEDSGQPGRVEQASVLARVARCPPRGWTGRFRPQSAAGSPRRRSARRRSQPPRPGARPRSPGRWAGWPRRRR